MGSMHWTDEEAKFIKAVFTWNDVPETKKTLEKAETEGELRIVVIGAKGTGKTAILTRFCNGTFRHPLDPPDPFYERGARHPVEIDGKLYMVDALEMPSKHISSNPMLEQALNITEGAVLVYDVRDPESLALTKGIQEFIKDNIGGRDYGLILVGNKNDASYSDRKVPWADGSTMADSFSLRCAFQEVSAKSGDGIGNLFPTLGREILRIKFATQKRKEEAELEARLLSQKLASKPAKRKLGLWKTLTTPFFRR